MTCVKLVRDIPTKWCP